MSKRRINVLITCVASQVIPKITQLVRSYNNAEVFIVGVDSQQKDLAVGTEFVDCFVQVPRGSDEEFVNKIVAVVKNHSIDIIFPGSDEEVIRLSEYKQYFKESLNCEIVCSGHESTILASNKFEMLKQIQSRGMFTGRFQEIIDAESINNFAKEIQFPHNSFIIKPKVGRGSRGVKLVKGDLSERERFFSKDNFFIMLEEAVTFFEKYPEERNHYFMMEYFSGEKFSTDLLIQNGEVVCAVTRSNGVHPKINPPTQVADIVFNQEVEKYVRDVIKVSDFDYFLQVETGMDEKGNIGFIESNARLDATLPITLGLEVNFYHEFLRYGIDGELYSGQIDSRTALRFFRYWEDVFVKI